METLNMPKKNLIKIKGFLYLQSLPKGYSTTLSEIAKDTCVNYCSLKVLLRRWHVWNYVRCYDAEGLYGSYVHRIYELGAKGRAYLKALPKWYPSEYLDTIKFELSRASSTRACFYDGEKYHVFQEPFTDKRDYWTTDSDPEGIKLMASSLKAGMANFFNRACKSSIFKARMNSQYRAYVLQQNRLTEADLRGV